MNTLPYNRATGWSFKIKINLILQHRVILIFSVKYNQHVIRQPKVVESCQICNAGLLFLWVTGYEAHSCHAQLSFWHFHMV